MSDNHQPATGERLAKAIARAGLCSRRDAEVWIAAGRVAVNGSVVKTPAFNVVEKDTIAVDGKPVTRKQATQLWLYHKPAGLMVTEKDPEGRPTVFAEFERLGLPRVLTVGRLDFNTEGLLLLTNDGGLKRTLELPATGWVRRYRVRAFGKVTQQQLDTLADGTTVDGVEYGPIEATLDSGQGSNVWITMGLREGKNREVRNVLGALGLEVNRLIRLSYGPFQLGDLPVGAVEQVKTRVLKDQLGKRLAQSSGADFETPLEGVEGQPRRRLREQPDSRPTERDRFGGLRKRPDFKRPERPEPEPRTVHFDDGRPSESFVPRGDPNKRGKRDDDFKRDGKPPREGGFKKRFEDGPRKPRREGDKPFGDRPPRRDGDKPFAKGPRKDGGKPFAKGPRREWPEGEERPFRKDADRPLAKRSGPRREGDRPFGDRPPRRDGDKPIAKGPRKDGGKPFAKGPRREGKPAARPEGGRRADGPRSDRPQGRPGARPGARPSGGRPVRPPRKPRDQ